MTPCFLYGKVSKVIDVEEKLQQAYLYDFYGELLNEHQRRIYEDFVFNDLSLGEIAGEEGITRQGVADMIKRCGKKLSDYEKKLHLVEKFLSVKQDVEEIHSESCLHERTIWAEKLSGGYASPTKCLHFGGWL